ncbi:A disintegrin and metalloproteinase with thrombospondin motifs like [Microplitis mediator]|uniref:A disintegrin and metalloproteinase with thrombospondin motifs like n=1 Tax=Microplitis mediator TaxID=375433 RepID=UPI0025526515|nr:A disintegrin and metalloproteinase with thrombospondin motifs like [Microplitis mediator]
MDFLKKMIITITVFNFYSVTSNLIQIINGNLHLNGRKITPVDTIVSPKTPVYYLVDIYGNTFINKTFNKFQESQSYQYYKYQPNIYDRVLFPKMLIITDDGMYQHQGDELIISYVESFLNNVNYYFRQISNPKIQLTIAGLAISTHPNILRFLEPSTIYANGNHSSLEGELTLDQMKQWLSNHFYEIDDYDFFLILSSWRVVNRSASSGYACESTYNVRTGGAIVDTLLGWKSYISAAHEIGHILGVQHDILHPFPNHFIMADSMMDSDTEDYYWSSFSIHSFSETYQNATFSCLLSKPEF